MSRTPKDLHPDSLVGYFGAELRRRRDQADLSQVELGDALGCSGQWVGQVELGEKPSEAFAIDLDTFFETGGAFCNLWKTIQRAGRKLVLPPGFPDYLECEARATSIRSFEAQLIPGLLQTEDYARAVMSAGQPPAALDVLVASRMDRRQVLERDDPPHVLVVIDESALHRPIGGTEVLRAQLVHLANIVTNAPHVQVRILPYTAAIWAGLDGSFKILGFAEEPDVAYLEAPGMGQLIEDPDRVAATALRFDLVMGEALPSRESLNMIMKALEDI